MISAADIACSPSNCHRSAGTEFPSRLPVAFAQVVLLVAAAFAAPSPAAIPITG